eukprot:TRINITY_DN11932_c0_g1_i3.p1 TRINITY_DN11932_c0_g1~~TRINITY_DN11932_c0_g1_i3.p1  ORF type:complete len:360 (+),score=66.03 TRINITY_DN11932_c0_g1_i3:142-1221(+)
MEFSVWFVLKVCIFAWLLKKFYNLFIREWFHILYYMRQGIKLDYYLPLFGTVFLSKRNEIKHGDAEYFLKNIVRKDPKQRATILTGFGKVGLVLLEHKLIEEFYKNANLYQKDKFFTYNVVRAYGNGILFMEGNRWKLHRRILSDAFSFDNLKKMTPIVNEAIKDHFAEMKDQKRLSKVGIMNEFQKITGDIVLKAFFGSTFSKEIFCGKPLTLFLTDYLQDLFKQSLSNPLSFIVGPQVVTYNLTANDRRMNAHTAALKDLARKTIENRRKEISAAYVKDDSRKDLLDFILSYNEKNKEEPLSDDEIIDTFITLFLTGMDTTGHLLGLSIYYLCKYPEYIARIMDEAARTESILTIFQ